MLQAGWSAEGWAWPPPVSEPLCPGVEDLLRRVQRRQRENQLELEPGTQLPAPPSQALCRPGCSRTKALISSCPRLGAEHALALGHEAVGNFATVSRRAGQGEWASPAIRYPFATD